MTSDALHPCLGLSFLICRVDRVCESETAPQGNNRPRPADLLAPSWVVWLHVGPASQCPALREEPGGLWGPEPACRSRLAP